LAQSWNGFDMINSNNRMKKTINILVVEDNEYFNNLLLKELKQCIHNKWITADYRYIFQSYTDPVDLISRIKSNYFRDNSSIAFIDYYLGPRVNGSQIIKMLKEQTGDISIVLLSHSKSVRDQVSSKNYDYFILKDNSATALCRLCLEQYLENKIYIPLD
jgi:CheY-like chemotaxis protein